MKPHELVLNWKFYQCSFRQHVASSVQPNFNKCNIKIILHHPYCPDLSPLISIAGFLKQLPEKRFLYLIWKVVWTTRPFKYGFSHFLINVQVFHICFATAMYCFLSSLEWLTENNTSSRSRDCTFFLIIIN